VLTADRTRLRKSAEVQYPLNRDTVLLTFGKSGGMHTIVPIMIILLLGGVCAAGLRRLRRPFLVRAGAAALLATVVWLCAVWLLL